MKMCLTVPVCNVVKHYIKVSLQTPPSSFTHNDSKVFTLVSAKKERKKNALSLSAAFFNRFPVNCSLKANAMSLLLFLLLMDCEERLAK